ncbi:MFS transporter [Corynebacterium kalidii]|uniref:MFS transporter n=1 Tax=Corynebacterium kalidii TaxID=2931982 RepID=A0A9X1WMN8_9CORY|nr:MFS transporter [Corynebacterium kalidii]
MPVVLAFVAVAVAAVNLRAGIASLGPVLSDVLDAFGTSSSYAGLITALPGVLFGVMGLCAVPVARRLGLSRTIVTGMVVSLVGLAVRPWVGTTAVFIVLTGLVVAGIALGNVLIPAWVKNYGGRRTVALMTVYGALLGASGAAGPLSALWFDGDDAWKWTLLVWALPCLVQVLVWVLVAVRTGADFPGGRKTSTDGDAIPSPLPQPTPEEVQALARTSLWRAPTAVFLTLFFGIQAMNAYLQMGWLPQIYVDSGVSRDVGSIALALVGGLNILGGIVMPTVIDRARSLAPFPVLFAVLTAAGYLGILLAPTAAPLVWALMLGLGGFCFPTAIALITARSRSSLVTARLSGFVQPMGYFIAGVGPFLIGLVYGRTGDWTGILVALIAVAVLMGVLGVRAGKDTLIDDELLAAR